MHRDWLSIANVVGLDFSCGICVWQTKGVQLNSNRLRSSLTRKRKLYDQEEKCLFEHLTTASPSVHNAIKRAWMTQAICITGDMMTD